ncbi:glycosyltransferase family 39 protein [Frankia tisae]|uniref:glycosyltransferase family 39 protein n=1 Tax=Frankia tisae TaxID=2950104 RepID=UPI0021BF7F85|nr:glycosyltransferase family 39 protein [Frankia tisae]
MLRFAVRTTAAARATATPGPAVIPDGTRFRPWRILRTAPPTIWAITLLFTAVLAGWSVMMPQYHAPDEPNHVDAVMRLVEGKGWPHPGHVVVTRGGVGAILAAPYGSGKRPRDLSAGPFTAAQATPRDQRPSWEELERTPAPRGGIQQIVQHPPLYYWVNAVILKAIPDGGDNLHWDKIIGILRLVSVAMVAPLPLLAWAGAHRLSDGSRVAGTCAALVPLAIPELAHIGSSVNNDNLLILTAGLATVGIVYVLRGDTSLRTAAWTGSFLGLALMTKSLAIVLVPMAVLAYVLAWSRARRDARALRATTAATRALDAEAGDGAASGGDGRVDDRPFRLADTGPAGPSAAAQRLPWRQILLGGALMVALGGWWWIVNVVRWGAFQPETPGFPLGQYLGDDWGAYREILINGTILRWWGSFGWFEVNLTTVPVRTGTALVIFFFALALIRARSWRIRVDLLLLLWVTWGLFGLMTLQSAKNFDKQFHVSGISGRYLYAGLASLAIGVGLGAAATGRYLSRIMPLLFLAGAVTLQVWSISMVFPHFWRPKGGDLGDAWDDMAAWSPWSEGTLVGIAVAVCALAVATLAGCLWVLVIGERDARPSRSARGVVLAGAGVATETRGSSGAPTVAGRESRPGADAALPSAADPAPGDAGPRTQGLREAARNRAVRLHRHTVVNEQPRPDRPVQAQPPSPPAAQPSTAPQPAATAPQPAAVTLPAAATSPPSTPATEADSTSRP